MALFNKRRINLKIYYFYFFQFWHRGIRILVDTFEPIGFENSPHYHSTTTENEPDAVFEILFKSRDSLTFAFEI